MITKPGIFYDMPTSEYFADPCPQPSFSQSLGKILLEKSPLHAWHAHPRLNPDYHADEDKKFDGANIAHKMLIGRGKDIVTLEFNDWRTKAAQEAREAAAAAGQIAVLGKHYALADRMVKAAREQLEFRGLDILFRDGQGEVVIAWQEKPSGIWCRQMIDWLTGNGKIFADYKTTGESAAPHALAVKMATDGWDIQAAMAERGLNILDGATPRRFLFVVQETERPYCLSIVEMSESVLTMGRKKLAAAMHLWQRCVSVDRWPGYPSEIVVPEYPGWAESKWLDREQVEFPNIPSDLIMAG